MKSIDQRTIETIRLLAADGVQKANSGHPGLPMGAAPMAYILWKDYLRGSATDPSWDNRDRFVLSAGHGSMLVYSLLNLFGYDLPMDELKKFRQMGSITPGHPEYGMTAGVETTTGPLGQGISNAVGMAIAERHLAANFNKTDFRIIDHYTYAIAGDGDLMEGVASEACSLAGHLKLGKLIVLYDDNNITIDGGTDKSFTEDVGKRFKAYGWEVLTVHDGNDLEGISSAIEKARIDTTKPTLIKVKNVIGYGSPNKAGTSGVHGAPLGEDELRLTKELMGWDPDEEFVIPEDVSEHMKSVIDKREIERFMWEEKIESYFEAYPDMKTKWETWHEYEMPEALLEHPDLWNSFSTKEATRASGGRMINIVKKYVPNLIGGSADLNESTKTYLKGFGDFDWDTPEGANIFFGVREHAMAAIMNGISLHGGLRAFGSTFLVFSDYMKPSIRLAALMGQPVIYVFTHDSIGVGEDGPTHQPIEQVMMLRGIPNLYVFRPGDPKETAVAWIEALRRSDGPSAIVLTRQALPPQEGVHRGSHHGGYTLLKEDGDHPEVILMASGSEVSVAVNAAKLLKASGIDTRVVSMLCRDQFDAQTEQYKEEVLPKAVRSRVSIEAGITMGWGKYTGIDGLNIGLDRFGESAPGGELMKHFGFTSEKVVEAVKKYLSV